MNIVEYAQRLGVKPTVKAVDVEAGKAGYEKYLADSANGGIYYIPGNLGGSLESYAKSVDEWRDKSLGERLKTRWLDFKDLVGLGNEDRDVTEMSMSGSRRRPTAPLMKFLRGEVTWEELQAIEKGIANQDYARPEDDWTDEERWAFGELYAKDRGSAFDLAEKINNQHAEEKKQRQAEKIAEWTDRNAVNKVLGSVGALGLNAVAGGAAYTEALGQKAVFGRTYNKDYLMPHEVANTIQGTVSENISETSKALGYIYNIGMSVGQSKLAGVTGGSAGALVQFFGMSASNGFTDAKARGADDNQALAFGALSGLAEAIPEMLTVDKFLGLASAAQVDNVFKSILKQAGAEALEEATTSALTEVADLWVMGGKSRYALTVQELMASGITEGEAKNKALTQTLLSIAGDAVTGAISGTASGGIAVGINKLNNKYLQKKTNTKAKETLTPEASNLIEEGKKYESSAKQAERLEKKLAEGKELSGYELRMLASSVSQATQDANVDAVRQAIVEKMKAEGVSEKDAKRLGEIALNKALGNDVSKIQDVMLKRNEKASKVYNQIDENNMESGLADSKWIESTPLKQLRYEAKAEKEGAVANTQSTTTTGVERLKQDLMAKKIAQDYKINDASLEGKFTVSEDDKIKFKKSGEDSKIHTEEITTSLTKEDIAELTAIEKLANELGVDIHVYESKKNKDGSRTFTKADGKVTSDSGWYDPNDRSIHIDLRAGNNGEGTMLYTAAHELVHFMKDVSPEHFDALEKLVTAELIKGGKSIEALLQIQRNSLIANGKNQTDADFEEVAREEMIADACMKFLASKSAVAEIKALKTKNRGLWNALKKFFTSLFTKINKVYKTVEPDSSTAQYLSNMRNAIKPIRDAFMEGITAAGEKYTAERKALGEGANVKVDANGEFVQGSTKDGKAILSNARTWEKGGRATLKSTLESEGFSADDVKAALTIMDEHMRLVKEFGSKYTAQDIANNAVLTTDVKTGESVLSAIISNGDYPVNIDLLTICKKREAYQQVINRLCESGMINQATVDSLAIAEINKILGKYGFETACLGCYVESRRIRIQEWADTIVKEWNGIVDKLEGKGKGKYLNAASDAFVSDLSNEEISKLSAELDEAYERDGLKYGRQTVVKKMEQLQREVPALRKYLSVSDLITPTGRANLKSWSQEVNSLINCRYGTNTPKIIQKFNPYNSELAQYGIVPKAYKSLRDYLYAIGGARMQSFSDFIVENWFDYAQIVADLSARKLPMHTYTKELSLVKLFGMTGIKINMSLIPDVDSSLGKEYAGLTKNSKGEYELIFADKDRYKATDGKSYMQSINFADAVALQNDPNYSANIGTIAIGISDKQIEMMLDDSRIRMVIPYHSSGMNPIFAHLVGIKNYNDYTNDQNTMVKRLVDANGKEKSVKLKKEQIASLTKGFQYNEALQRLGDARAAANEYKEWCRDTSKHTIEIDGKTYYAELTPKFEKFSDRENYYKLLTDYNAYDCITEESKPQQDVTQTYPENFATMLEDELKARDIYAKKQDAKWDDAMAEINAYLETHTRADTVKYADEHGIKISAKDRKLAKQESAKKEIRSKARAVDTNGNELTEAQKEYFKGSTVRDFKGNLMVLYHGTTANFNEFKKGDVGFHFGTKGAARGRVGYGKNVTLKEVYLNIKNPIVFDDDLGSWDADYRLTRELYDRGVLTQAEAETVLLTDSKLYKRTTEAANKKLAEVLLAKGYDGIQYTNTHESKKDSTSYIIFDSNQAKLITNTNPTTSKDIRHKARSTVTSGQYAQTKANLSHSKVYSKVSAMSLVSKIAPGIRNRSYEALSDELWKGLNTYTTIDDKRAFASDMSEMFIDRMLVDTLVPNKEWDEASENIAYLKTGITSINFTEGEKMEIRHIFDVDGARRIYGRWGYKTSKTRNKRPYDLDVFITDISREMPGMEYLAEMHPVDALVEIDDLYNQLNETLKEKYKSAYEEFSEEEINEIKRSIASDIMKAYDELGEQTAISKYLQEKFEYYQSRIDYWKAEKAKTDSIARWNGILSTKAQQIRDLKKGAFYNATQHHQDVFKESIEELAKIQWRGNIYPKRIREVFAKLKPWYTKDNPMLYNKDNTDNLYSEAIAAYIEKISDTEKDKFDVNTYAMVYDVMNHLYTMMRNYNKVFRAGRWEDAPTLVDAYLKIMEETKRQRGALGRLRDGYTTEFLEPMAVARRADNYDPNGFFTQTMEDLRRASINASVGEMNLRKEYDGFIDANKKYLSEAAKTTVTYRGVEVPKLNLIGLYMTMKRKHARAGLALNGFTFTKKNKWWDSEDFVKVPGYLSAENVTQEMIDTATEEQMKVIEQSFTETDKEYIRILEKLFNEDLKALKIERDMERQGYTNATLDYYYPIMRGAIAENVDTSKISDQNRATNASFNKNTVTGAKQRLIIISADAMVNRHISDMCKYYYMSQAIENYNVLYNCDISGNANNPVNISGFVKENKIWDKDYQYFKKLVADMQGIRDPQTTFEKAIEGMRGGYAKFALGANLKVLFTQFSSMIAAGDVISYGSILSAKKLTISSADVDKYCPLAAVRNYDKSILRAMTLTDKFGKVSEAFTMGISKVDRYVIKRLFAACQIEAQKNGLGELGTEENKIAAGKLLEKVIIETQQNSFATERSSAMRSKNELLKAITMFTADGMKIVSRMYDAFGELSVAKKSGDKARIEAARKKLAKTIAAAVNIAIYMTAIATLFNWLYDRDDEEDENKLLSLTMDTVGNFIGALPLISDLYDYMVDGFEVESVAFDTINNLFSGINNIRKDVVSVISGDGERSKQDINRDLRTMLYGVGQVTGLPFRNIYNLSRGIIGKFSSVGGYKLDSKFYETSLATDLDKAIESGDNAKTAYIMALIYDDKLDETVSKNQIEEITKLTKEGYSVLPRDIPDEITRNGKKYKLTAKQKDVYIKTYSQVVDAIDKLISSSFYSRMSTKEKADLISYYHDQYREMAVNEVLGLTDSKKTIYSIVGFDKFAEYAYIIKDIESDKDKNGNTISGSKKKKVLEKIKQLSVSEEKKLLLIAYSGYTIDSEKERQKLLKYLNKLKISTSNKKNLAEMCGFKYKNGKIVENKK